MCESKLKFLPALAVVFAVVGAAEITPEMQRTITRVDVGRQEVEQQGGKQVREANELFANGQYMDAVKKYLEAIKIYDAFSSGIFVERSEFCRKRINDCYYREAIAAMQRADEAAHSRDFDEAIRICRKALKFCNKEQVDELTAKIAIYEKRRDSAVEREEASTEKLLPNLKSQEYQIQVLMEQGRKLALNGELSRAARKFQEALLIDPFNADALQCLQAVNRRISKIGIGKYVNEHRRLMGEIEWKRSTPYQQFEEQAANNLIENGDAKPKLEENGAELRRRLAEIKLAKVALFETTIGEAVDYLRNESLKQDPEKRGVNIVYLNTVRRKRNNADAANENGDAGDDAGNADADKQENKNAEPAAGERITLEARDQSLLEILDMLCRSTKAPKMRYQVDENAVLISPDEQDLGGMITKSIHIYLPEGTTSDALKNSMTAEGIEFRSGSGISYFPSLGRVVIKNDSKNLEKMEEFFERSRSGGEMIQLQIKLVELTQNDIDELAFNWQYAVNYNLQDKRTSRTTVIDPSSNELLRYYAPDGHTKSSVIDDATYSFAWANSDGSKITANMFALDWADSKDVLASPRITTLSGQTAKIEMVTIRYFPDNWEVPDVDHIIQENGISITRITPQPELKTEKKLGVSFEIRPELTPSGLIKMKLNFPITTFADEWVIYDNTSGTDSSSSDDSDDDDYIQMPVFNTREIETEVMLHDGETIVLGGVNKDDTTTVNDKIPILGDLPLIGRLFQSKYSTASKNNLLIFLTCRLVKPDGSAYYPDKQVARGIPRFGRIE